MDKDFLTEQREKASEYLQKQEGEIKQKISIIFQYLSALLEPEKFTDIESEDLRKLALELGFQENTLFDKWVDQLKQ
ncbi:MAG: hypothetical protein WAZ27_04605 [Minisyncoccia bacterium]|jgi:hypothetical protein